jgi:hypothetical protein
MNRDDIIRMAGESWLTEYGVKELAFGRDVEIDIEALEQFAALVAAAEREACAERAWKALVSKGAVWSVRQMVSDAIQARSIE